MPVDIAQDGDDVLIPIKAVPGASRDQVAGPLGNRLKVRIAAPPEGGKANDAICALLARELGVAKSAVSIEHGAGVQRKWCASRGWRAAS